MTTVVCSDLGWWPETIKVSSVYHCYVVCVFQFGCPGEFVFSSPKCQGSVSIMGGLVWAII